MRKFPLHTREMFLLSKARWRPRNQAVLIFILASTVAMLDGQGLLGELRISVHDLQGAAVPSTLEVFSATNEFHREYHVPTDGQLEVRELPFGTYRLAITAAGFAPATETVNVRSQVPLRVSLTLGIAPLKTQVEVTDARLLVDPSSTGAQFSMGQQLLSEPITSQPGREVTDFVSDLPGWIYEANGVLHPRGSEYDVQYVVDGVPVTENRSLSFAPALNSEEVESMRVLTADYPAEYGRKLGGVVEVTTSSERPRGLHGRTDLGGGTFDTGTAAAELSYSRSANHFLLSGNGFHTARYLDPPVLQNYTNNGNGGGFSASYERDISDADRLRITVNEDSSRFEVPNYLVQEIAGQRQNVSNGETGGQVFFRHLISPDLLFSAAASVRDASANLNSNVFSTPVIVSQDRGYRERYVRADLAGHRSRHDWKVGADGIFNLVHENLSYQITDPTQFDPNTRLNFQFSDSAWERESSAYAQDELHLGNWNASLGLRFDHYGFVVQESAWSPRLGVSRYFRSANLLIHAAYDRVFQTPAIENLLLASSPQLNAVNPIVERLPVRPGRGNYYEVGLTKPLFDKLRLDAQVFRRDFRNYSDDDVLLDTGVAFPIAFRQARIIGEELRLEAPHWWRFSGYLSYANQSGFGRGPITGGLLLGSEALTQLSDTSRFAVSQDQRNTARARIRFQSSRSTWLATSSAYGSGLPIELDETSYNALLSQYGQEILDRVNLPRGRVRPNFSLGAAAGAEIYRKEQRSLGFQIEATNLTDRVNVINFAGLFSGTAVAAPRSVSARVLVSF